MRKIILIFCAILSIVIVILISRGGISSSAFTVELVEGSVTDGFAYSNLYSPQIRGENITGSEITIVWDFERKELVPKRGLDHKYTELTGFRVYRDGFWFTDVPKERNSVTDAGLFPGESYKYKVVALTFDNKVEGRSSEEIEVKTLAGDPNPIINFPKVHHKVTLVEGASVAFGMSAGGKPGWADLVARYLTKRGSRDLHLFNKAIRGSFSYEVADRLGGEVKELNPDLVMVDTAGINDLTPSGSALLANRGFLSMLDFRKNIEKMIESIQPSDRRALILVNINYFDFKLRGKDYGGRLHRKRAAWNKTVRDVANERGLILVDVEKALIDNGGIELLNDTLHPNGEGHAIMAGAIIGAIERYKK